MSEESARFVVIGTDMVDREIAACGPVSPAATGPLEAEKQLRAAKDRRA